jgi:hypothetical protein
MADDPKTIDTSSNTDRDDAAPSDVGRRSVLQRAGMSGLALLGAGVSAGQVQAQAAAEPVAATGPMWTRRVVAGAEARGQWPENTHYAWFEFPTEDPAKIEVWGHTDATSYAPGDTVKLHVTTTAPTFDVTVIRDGGTAETVLEQTGIPGRFTPTPTNVFETGTGWPVGFSFEIPSTWRSGGYMVILKATDANGQSVEQEAFFVLRAASASANAIAFVLATTTWQAYNDWGGSNFYEGVSTGPDGALQLLFCPTTSVQRPWARGFIRIPEGAPRIPFSEPLPMGAAPRYPNLEWAYARGYAKYAAAAGWATFDRHFARWAEQNGYELHYFAQDDLHRDGSVLSGYKTMVMVGHDEYHTLAERDAIDSFVEAGGNLVRLGGNMIWQARRENGQLVCYKARAQTEDPVRDDPTRRHTLTTVWENQAVNRPAAQTWGIGGVHGVYAKLGGFQPRASGGYTVYRPKHWALEGTDLYYGDQLGARSTLAGFEGDSVLYTFENGLPVPTGEFGALPNTEIIAMSLCGTEEEDHGNYGTYLYAGDADLQGITALLFGEVNDATRARVRYGASMMVNVPKGDGDIFNGGSAEWVNALKMRDPFVEKITRNVLDRYQGTA